MSASNVSTKKCRFSFLRGVTCVNQDPRITQSISYSDYSFTSSCTWQPAQDVFGFHLLCRYWRNRATSNWCLNSSVHRKNVRMRANEIPGSRNRTEHCCIASGRERMKQNTKHLACVHRVGLVMFFFEIMYEMFPKSLILQLACNLFLSDF